MRKFPIGLTIATLISLAILIGLGAWQMRRLAWKEDMLAHIAALNGAPPRPIADVLPAAANGQEVEFTRVVVDCPGIATAPFQQIYSLVDGKIANRLVSACPATSGGYDGVLVDRGFVDETVSARPPVQPSSTPVRVVGVLRKGDRKQARLGPPVGAGGAPVPSGAQVWYGRNLVQLAAALDLTKPAPYFVMAETSTNPEWKALTPAGLPTDIPNRHLEYALTWFGLAGALACVYAALLWRKMKGR